MQNFCSNDATADTTNTTNNDVHVPEAVEVVQNPAFGRAAVGTGTKAGSPPAASGVIEDYLEPNAVQPGLYDGAKLKRAAAGGAAEGAAGMADYLEPDSVQPKVYEGIKKTQQLVAAGKLVLDLDGYVVDEGGLPTSAASSPVVYATAIDDDAAAASGNPAIVYAVPVEMGTRC